MIKVKKGKVKINGNVPELLTDFVFIVRSLLKCNIDTKSLDAAFSIGFMNEKEIGQCQMDLEKLINKNGGKKDNG